MGGKKGEGDSPWETKHSDVVTYGILKAAFDARLSIYSLPGLIGEVDNNGCDRLGKRVVSALKQFAVARGLDPQIVDQIKEEAKGYAGAVSGSSGTSKGRRVKRQGDRVSGISNQRPRKTSSSNSAAGSSSSAPFTPSPTKRAKVANGRSKQRPIEIEDSDEECTERREAWIEELE